MENKKFIKKLPKQVQLFLKKRRVKNRNRLLKKISQRVKLLKLNDRYIVRLCKDGVWEDSYATKSIAKAIHRKHNAMLIAIRDLGYRPLLLERIKKRKLQK